MLSPSRTTWSRKGVAKVLDTVKLKNKKSTISFWMRGRDANILQVFTIDFSEIQFIVNHNSRSERQKKCKEWMNLRKKTIHTNSLQRKEEDKKDNDILFRTKQATMGLRSLNLIKEPLSWKNSHTPRIWRTNWKSHPSKSTKTNTTGTRTILQRLLLHRSSWSTYRMAILAFISKFLVTVRIRMELEVRSQFFFFGRISLFLLQLVSFAVESDRSTLHDKVCGQNTLTPRIFSHICAHFNLVHMHRMIQDVAARVSWEQIHPHVITCLSVCYLSLFDLSLVCQYLLPILYISSVLVIILHVVETAEY